MKRLLAVSVLLLGIGSSFLGTSSWAQEENANRTINPGEDPNEAKNSKTFEADVAAPGVCPECIARMKHNRLGDDTTYRPQGPAPSENSSPGSSKDGTR